MKATTFATILADTAAAAGAAAWQRATTASRLRHLARDLGNARAARLLSHVQGRAMARAATLLPHAVRIRRDLGHPGAHLSLELRRKGRLHVPPSHEGDVLRACRMTRAPAQPMAPAAR